MNKHKKMVSILAGVMAAMMLLSLLLGLLPTNASATSVDDAKEAYNEAQDNLKDLQKEQDAIEAQIAELKGQMNENWSSIEEMVAQKDVIDQQIALLYAEVENINEQIRSYTVLIADNQAQLDEAEAKLAELNEKYKERIRAMEEEGKISYWSVLFKANSFTELIDCINMMQEIQAADKRRMEELDAAAAEVEQARTTLEAEKTELEASRAALEAAQAELESSRAEADALLAQLNADQIAMAELEEEYEASEAELSEQIAKAEKEVKITKEEWDAAKAEWEKKQQQQKENSGSGSSGSGNSGGGGSGSSGGSSGSSSSKWAQPCAYVKLTSPYGYRIHPTTGEYKFHHGVDLANSKGTPIYATRSGIVTVATWGSTYGNYVTINHGDGYSSLYAHMTNYVVSKGEYVEKGQLIGYMGSTGRSTGPHLHFAIYYNGSSVNPMNYIN